MHRADLRPPLQTHTMTPELLPTFGLGTAEEPHNFCRNPDHSTRGPWCYVAAPGAGREFCDVESCVPAILPADVPRIPESGDPNSDISSSDGGLNAVRTAAAHMHACPAGVLLTRFHSGTPPP